ncbi:hypothetical protein PU634_07195 [Oceanimonas pelagia]|uniref:Uncharacterized protein n=1 Tax=Oceanimonas pelagia TaxID=3028314 RepID=A0AA50KS84_9GAMM|nr:hypothetical protein [Oceanimonas pelagia]WMC12140.1 hypothetical protein PU634_07195 [Oceanimonas pelagia]
MRERLTGPKLVQILLVMAVLSAAFWLRTCSDEQETTESVTEKFDYCDIAHEKCAIEQHGLTAAARLLGGGVQAETPFKLELSLSDPTARVTHSVLEGDTMYMGTLPALLQPAGEGQWRGQALVGSCTEARMLWAWVVTVEHQGQTLTYRFLFEVRH